VANLAAADLRGGLADDLAAFETPVLLVAGDRDAIAPLEQHQRPLFEAKRVGPAQLAIIGGGSHCGFLQPPAIAGAICDRGDIDPPLQLAIAHGLLADWFLLELAGQESLRDRVWSESPRPGVRSETRPGGG
jgi:pimeloyl-ACP methyl ester carboxylesterase